MQSNAMDYKWLRLSKVGVIWWAFDVWLEKPFPVVPRWCIRHMPQRYVRRQVCRFERADIGGKIKYIAYLMFVDLCHIQVLGNPEIVQSWCCVSWKTRNGLDVFYWRFQNVAVSSGKILWRISELCYQLIQNTTESLNAGRLCLPSKDIGKTFQIL